MDRKTRELLTIHRAMHSQADIDRLYIPRADGGRGMIIVEDCVDLECNNLRRFVEESEEQLRKAASNEGILKPAVEGLKQMLQNQRKDTYQAKPLHGQFERATKEQRGYASWTWLRKGVLKKETEGLIMAAQDQALRTNSIKRNIDKEDISPLCRMCGEREESISHIVAECKKLAQNEYKCWRHDQVARVLHWNLCRNLGFPHSENWYQHEPESVLRSDSHKMLWDFTIQTDHSWSITDLIL